MKKSIWIIIGILAVIVLWAVKANNSINIKHENATSKWANVQADYQRRKDVVEQAINVVKGAGNYERGTLEAVIKARNDAPQLNADDLSEENIAKLTATKNYQDFQTSIEGCENRINMSRKMFNEAVQDYNTCIKMFPRSIIASMFGHKSMGYFQASEGAENAPSTEALL